MSSFNNQTTVQKVSVSFSLVIMICLIVVGITLLFDVVFRVEAGLAAGCLGGLAMLLFRFGGYEYLLVKTENQVLEIRYYHVFPFGRKYKMVRIPTDQLSQIKLVKGFMGVRSQLILYQKKNQSVSKYPGIGLAAVSRNQLKELLSLFTPTLIS